MTLAASVAHITNFLRPSGYARVPSEEVDDLEQETMTHDASATPVVDDQHQQPHAAAGAADAKTPVYVNSLDRNDSSEATEDEVSRGIHILEAKSTHWYDCLKDVNFWILVVLGQVLSLCITATTTFTTYLADAGNNVPAFQTVFNYILIFIIYFTVFITREGFAGFWRALRKDWWRYLIMSFLDVEGNYFTVRAFADTDLLSTQLINFWSIVCVVIISFVFLKVRYRWVQIFGILVCCGGMGLLIASDYITSHETPADPNDPGPRNKLRGDLFALLGATLYGTSNVLEEFLVSRASMYHVLTFIGGFGMIINGVQAAIFDRESFQEATWNSQVGGWLTGYTICLTLFYSLAPLMLRMGSAAFFDISLLTANFWIAVIGVYVFHKSMDTTRYPAAFVMIIIGILLYSLFGSFLGDSKKPWLGENQEQGFAGLGTAKLRAINEARNARGDVESGDGPRNGSTPAPASSLLGQMRQRLFPSASK
ncbi:hypothetical protein VHEMI06651 [[Torrubiella] hemipterigena]|uniref:DUF914 domain membrane protein n=1 Tax=[Torrubiella] hemipterigena TaxID=1531966 RepID=A0A0A1TJY5_9HYPO|nr:hypothetical protein VHEMI06651 [[Torrubiella] hemipterigena]